MYAAGALICVYAYTVTPVFPARAWNGSVFFAVTALSCLFTGLRFESGVVRRVISWTLAVCFAGFLATFAGALYSNYRTCQEETAREQSILEQRDAGIQDVVIPVIDADNPYNAFSSHEDAYMQTGENSNMAEYFGVRSISKADDSN